MSDYMKKTDFYGKIWIWTAAVVVLFAQGIYSIFGLGETVQTR